MDAAHDNRRQLGRLMVDEGFLAEEQLARALEEQARTGRPLGTILVELGFVSAGAVSNALAEQHGGLLKTEFGVSAGLHVLPGGAPREQAPSAPAPSAAPQEQAASAPDPSAAPREQAPPAPDPLAARVHELESQLRAVLTERNTFAQNLNDVNARLREAAQAQDAEVARVTAAAAAHIDGLEAQLRAAAASHQESENAVRLCTGHIAELQREVAELRAELDQRPEEQAAQVVPLERSHLLYVPSSSGYRLLEQPGPAPASGALLDVDGVSFAVTRIGVSPFPGSRLRCVFLERA